MMTINDLYIRTIDHLENAVMELGILPFFMNSIRGFSIDEHVDPGIWFTGEYGWGVAEYSTPEHFMGDSFRENVYRYKPEESYEILFEHLRKILPGADETSIKKFLK